MAPHEAMTVEIDRILAELTSGSTADPREAGIRLAELIERRDRTQSAELDRVETVARAFHSAATILQRAATVEDVVCAICPGAAGIAECDNVVFSELDGLHATPLRAAPGLPLPAPFRLPSAFAGPGSVGIPAVFTRAESMVFRVDIDGRPAAVIRVGATLAVPVVDALISYAGLVGTAFECAALDRRRHRQRDLLHMLWGRDNSAPEMPSPPLASTQVPPSSGVLQALTIREREILELMLTGSSNAAIATDLVVSVETVRSHVKKVLRKCGVANRAELIARFDTDPPVREQ
ncbi:helix-turn-helix transcriptional regulator [Rhodococcus sp. T2V]|uniref:helix-turn-helix transcriptional regulator n=1 Tax=Rhodococcus sp. T2V TaxID=3034164 RepID=UPI0023E0CC58|nr:helix-turn-helix transcriptional regulator [Rhodococcus sp. T2V]MDF3306014.1 helix-turn-helix transcriptional regulator [Rhodococcus sp. T2V]